jgi:TPR repeat protein
MRTVLTIVACLLLEGCLAGVDFCGGCSRSDGKANSPPNSPPNEPVQAPASTAPLTKLAQKAESGDPAAQYRLAYHSPEVAVRRYWYCRSASQSHSLQGSAFLRLGDLSEYDLQDKVAAYGWYTLAAQHGGTDASVALNRLGNALTIEQTQAAKETAADWKTSDCGELPSVQAG